MDEAALRADMIEGLEYRIGEPLGGSVLTALQRVPRGSFLDEDPYADRASDENGTRALAPETVARMLTALDADEGDEVLIVGAGVATPRRRSRRSPVRVTFTRSTSTDARSTPHARTSRRRGTTPSSSTAATARTVSPSTPPTTGSCWRRRWSSRRGRSGSSSPTAAGSSTRRGRRSRRSSRSNRPTPAVPARHRRTTRPPTLPEPRPPTLPEPRPPTLPEPRPPTLPKLRPPTLPVPRPTSYRRLRAGSAPSRRGSGPAQAQCSRR